MHITEQTYSKHSQLRFQVVWRTVLQTELAQMHITEQTYSKHSQLRFQVFANKLTEQVVFRKRKAI